MDPTVTAIGLSTINGLPAHVLLVHFVVVLVPLSGIALIASLKPSIAKRFGIWLPVLSIAAFLSVLVAMNAGGWLQNHVVNTALVRHHVAIAGQLWPFSAVVGIASLVVWWFTGRATTTTPSAKGFSMTSTKTVAIVGVIAVLASVGSIVEVVRIGEAGSRAAWTGHFSQQAIAHH